MQGNVLGQSGSSTSGLNVYAQLAEPSKKDGVWIKTEETKFPDEIFYLQLENMPCDFTNGSAVTIGKNIYLFGGDYYGTKAYKYNTITNTYTELNEVPYYCKSAFLQAIGRNIYIIEIGRAHV